MRLQTSSICLEVKIDMIWLQLRQVVRFICCCFESLRWVSLYKTVKFVLRFFSPPSLMQKNFTGLSKSFLRNQSWVQNIRWTLIMKTASSTCLLESLRTLSQQEPAATTSFFRAKKRRNTTLKSSPLLTTRNAEKPRSALPPCGAASTAKSKSHCLCPALGGAAQTSSPPSPSPARGLTARSLQTLFQFQGTA